MSFVFNGTAAQAIKLYETALGAKADNVMPWTDAPGQPSRPETKDRLMHASLQVTADMARKFEALSTGGKITMPLQDTFWGAKFGMLTDAYGVSWMFNCTAKKD